MSSADAPSAPDIMNDAGFDAARSHDKAPGEGDTCRICRSEGSAQEPLFYPCKCSGSIKFVHQDCLMEWLSHSNKKHCELCKTPFRFTKLYDSHMPHTLPLAIFLKRACVHTIRYILTWARAITVALVWLVVLPWCIRWSWRGLFWILDAGWARDPWLAKMENTALQHHHAPPASPANVTVDTPPASMQPVTLSLSRLLLGALFNPWRPMSQPSTFVRTNATHEAAIIPPQSSLLSGVKAVNSLTSSLWTNRFILDVLEGQIITFSVVIVFILVFLIREWVVQQQPIINAAAHIRDAELQLDVAERAARRLQELENEAQPVDEEARARAQERNMGIFEESSSDSDASGDQSQHFVGWYAIEMLMDNAGVPYEFEGEDHDLYMEAVEEARKELDEQLKLAMDAGIPPSEVAENLFAILENLGPTEKDLWWDVLLKNTDTKHMMLTNLSHDRAAFTDEPQPESSAPPAAVAQFGSDEEDAQAQLRRPAMPPRDASSHAQRVLQSIEEGSNTSNRDNQPSHADADGISSRGSWQSVAHSPNPEASVASEAPINPHSWAESTTDTTEASASSISNADEGTTAANSAIAAIESDGVTLNPQPSEAEGDFASEPPTVLPLDTSSQGRSSSEQGQGAHRAADDNPRREGQTADQRQEELPKSFVRRLFDWFWADIVPDETDPLPGVDDEEVIRNEAEEPPFVHAHGGELDPQPDAAQDPEVLQAAAEAGLDADAVDDAEDLEGILELIGMQGPLVGLLQTAMFCGVLITTTLWTAIGTPYLFGKLALIFLGDPVVFMIMAPLRLISLTADAIVDSTIYVGGVATYLGAEIVSQLLSLLVRPILTNSTQGHLDFLAKRAHTAANAAAGRLSDAFSGEGPFETGFLMVSIHARQSLLSLKAEIAQILGFVVRCVSGASYHAQNSTVSDMYHLLSSILEGCYQTAEAHYAWIRTALQDGFADAMKNGSFTFTIQRETQHLDPALASWTSVDRCLTIFAGYMFLAMIGTMYLLRKDSLFNAPSLQKIEKSFADVLKQAGGVLKVILIISIEMLVFPLYCGLLLDCALLPLFENASVMTRFAFANRSPWLFAFLHWFIGTCYMFHFALFVSMCRRIMRNGVLYFIRDPDDPTFHPVRDVLERSVTTQLRKIAFSALVYGGLVIVCLGGVVWSIARIFDGIFPVKWARPEPMLEFPTDFLVYNLLAPVVARYLFPSKGMEKIFGHWLKLCARSLRLSDFLFGERRKVEEGHIVNESWLSKLNPWKNERSVTSSEAFVKDGRYVRAPASDQVRIPKGEGVFLEVTEEDDRVDQIPNTGVQGRQNGNFTKVYVPPWFRARIASFIACLWSFAIATGFGVTVLPMVFGRKLLSMVLPERVTPNDLYAFAVGLIVLGIALQTLVNGRNACRKLTNKAFKHSVAALGETLKRQAARMIRSVYVYGFAVIIVPTLFALVLQLYLILPLHTYMGSTASTSNTTEAMTEPSAGAEVSLANMTTATVPELQSAQPLIASHTFHILQDWTLGFVYGRVVLRLLLLSRNSRPAAALRMITRDGFTNPNVRLATRAFVLPTLLIFSIMLFFPPLVATVFDTIVLSGSGLDNVRTKVYRYSYPICAGQVLALWCMWEMAKGMQRWRGRIKDEVYLIGERLHNFGERRPPEGSKSVVRRQS